MIRSVSALCVVVLGCSSLRDACAQAARETDPVDRVRLQFVEPDGAPRDHWMSPYGRTDEDGIVVHQLAERDRGSRDYLVSAERLITPYACWVLPACTELLDLRDVRLSTALVKIQCPASGRVRVRPTYRGREIHAGTLEANWWRPFDRHTLAWAGADPPRSTVLRYLPIGIPVSVRLADSHARTLTLTSQETVELEFAWSHAPSYVRYRLVDALGNPLRGILSGDPKLAFDAARAELRVPASVSNVRIDFSDSDGASWWHPAFRRPQFADPGEYDGGDLVLRRNVSSEFCRGRVVDPRGHAVLATVVLGSTGCSTKTGEDGRFVLRAPESLEGVQELRLTKFDVVRYVSRGAKSVLIVVDPERSPRVRVEGAVLGLGPSPIVGGLHVTVTESRSDTIKRTTGERGGGRLSFDLEQGAYGLRVELRDGTEVLRAEHFVVPQTKDIVRPPVLRRAIPSSLRVATLRFVDRKGEPIHVLGFGSQAVSQVQALVPREGATVQLPIGDFEVRGDREILWDRVLVTVRVRGLPERPGYRFGLAYGRPAVPLEDGRVKFFVPRGVTIRPRLGLVDMRAPNRSGRTEWIRDFDGEIRVPETGAIEEIVLDAPPSLRGAKK